MRAGDEQVQHPGLAKFCYRASSAVFAIALSIALSACGGGSSGSGNTNPAPFNTAKGEGVLTSSSLVTTYSTGGSSSAAASDVAAPQATASPVPDLQTYYIQTICPTGLTPQNCMQNETSLDTPDFGNFDLSANPISNNPLGIQNVDAFKITYGAINVGGTPVTVSGGIDIPELPPSAIRGIILYFHGTTIQRSNIPSNFITADNPGGNYQGILLAGLWASQGYVVVMPDYIGLGDDTTNPHPYVAYPEENAQSALAMVKAARAALKDQVKGKLPLFINGYSEGGAYALEAGHLMQNNPRYAEALKVKLADVVPMSGAFDLTGTMLPYLFYNISSSMNPWFSLDPTVSALSKPYLSGDLVLSFANYAGIAPTDIVVDPFYVCTQGNLPNCGTSGNIDGLYYEADITDTAAVLAMVGQAGQTNWTGTNNSVEPLLTMTYAQALLNADPTNPLYAQLLTANTYQFVPNFPLALVSLNQDSVVTRVNTDVAFQYITTQNPTGPYQEFLVDNSLFLVPGFFSAAEVDHTTELPFLAVLALNQFNLNSVPAGGL
jgi:hypothetical protein